MSLDPEVSKTATIQVPDAVLPPQGSSATRAVISLGDLHKNDCWTSYLGKQLDEENQKLLATLMLMSNKLQCVDSDAEQNRLIQLILFACKSITQDNNIFVAKAIQESIDDIINERDKNSKKWTHKLCRLFSSSITRRIYIVLGLLISLAGAVVLSLFVDTSQVARVVSIPSETFIAAIIFGTLGSSLSIMLRFNEHRSKSRNIPGVDLFVIGLSKPIIGAVFALVLFAIYKAGILSLYKVDDPEREVYFLIVLFFLAGFSERFVRDILSKFEREEEGPDSDKKK
jgi:hypothetical protein